MSLTLLLGTKQFDVSGKSLTITNASSGTDSAKFVVRVKAPDDQYYYFNGNNASTFAAPNTATIPDFTTNTGTVSVSAPLDSNGNVQNGLYTIDMNAYDSTTSSLVSMTTQNLAFSFVAPAIVLTPELSSSNASLTLVDQTNYSFATAFLSGSSYLLSLAKNILTGTNPGANGVVQLPSTYNQSLSLTGTGVDAILANQESVEIINPLYAGLYTLTLNGVLIWTIGTGTSAYNISWTINYSEQYTATSIGGICSVECGIESLNNRYITALNSGDPEGAAYLLNKLIAISIQVTLYNLAIQCQDTTTADACLAQIQLIGGFSANCCNSDQVNYLIQPYFVTNNGYVQIVNNVTNLTKRSILKILTNGLTPLYDDGLQSTVLDLTQLGGTPSTITGITIVTLTSLSQQTLVGTGNPTVVGGYNNTQLYQFTFNESSNVSPTTLNIDGNGALPIYALVAGNQVAPTFANGITYQLYLNNSGTAFLVQTGKNTVIYDNNGLSIAQGVSGFLKLIQHYTPTALNSILGSILGVDSSGNVQLINTLLTSTYFVDPNGNDSGVSFSSIVSPFATINGASLRAPSGGLINVNASTYSPTVNTFLTNKKYFLNAGVQINQGSGTSIINIQNGDNVFIRGYGKLYTNNNVPPINIVNPCTVDIELDEVYADTGLTGAPLIEISSSNVNGRIKIKKLWANPSSSNFGNFIHISVSGTSTLDIYIEEVNIPLSLQSFVVFTNSASCIVNIYVKRVLGAVSLTANSGIIRYFIDEDTTASINGSVVTANVSGGIIAMKGNIVNTYGSAGSSTYGLQTVGSSGTIILYNGTVVNVPTGATNSIGNSASSGILQVIGQAFGNKSISSALSGTGNGTYTVNTALLGL